MHIKEEFIQFIWKCLLFDTKSLKSNQGDSILILKLGQENFNQGPDFLYAEIRIGAEIFYGHIEIHIENKDWYRHKHHKDKNYDNVVLHVVYKNTADISTANSKNNPIPILCLEDYISESTLSKIEGLMTSKLDIPCTKTHQLPEQILIENFKTRIFSDRTIRKSNWIGQILKLNNYDYEASFFQALLYGFGIKVNSDIFLSLAQSIPMKVLMKNANNITKLESLFLGQANLISTDDSYGQLLEKEYQYLKHVHKLKSIDYTPLKSKMMPASFPVVRLVQFAALIYKEKKLFSKLNDILRIEDSYTYFKIDVSEYWKTHYDFGKPYSKNKKVRLSESFIEKILINVILPFRFLKEIHEDKSHEKTIELYYKIKAENNKKTKRMQAVLSLENKNAYDSQSIIEWYSNYCLMKRCFECPIGYKTVRATV